MRLTRLLIILLPVLLLSACSKSTPSSQASDGTTSDETAEPRFAVFSPAIGVMLRDLGFEDDIVGRHSYDTALSQSIPVVGSHIEIDDEMLINAQPTILVFEENTIEIPQRIRKLAEEREWAIWTYRLESLDDIALTIDDLYLKLVGFPTDANSDDDPMTFEVNPTKRFDVDLPSARLARAWGAIGPSTERAGRTLLLAGTDPAGALGPGSFHAQMIDRMGIENAITDGAMWQELDLEDLVELAPDSIILFAPESEQTLIGEQQPMGWDEIQTKLGPIATIPIPAIEHQQVCVVTHPQALLPSTTLAQVADEIRSWIDTLDDDQP
jgi:ABC-type Fe3+-hydroxamate transport system substrate-binding protein